MNINRIAKFPLAKNADLVTQSFVSSHDNVKKQIMVKFHITEICACSHTLKGKWIEYLVYLRIKHSCLHIFGLIVFNYWNQINQIKAYISFQFTEQLDT